MLGADLGQPLLCPLPPPIRVVPLRLLRHCQAAHTPPLPRLQNPRIPGSLTSSSFEKPAGPRSRRRDSAERWRAGKVLLTWNGSLTSPPNEACRVSGL